MGDSSVLAENSPYVFKDTKYDVIDLMAKHFPLGTTSKGVALAGSKKPGYSHVFRNSVSPNALKWALAPGIETYAEMFSHTAKRRPQDPCFAFRQYDYEKKVSAPEFSTLSYGEVDELKRNFASGLFFLLQNCPYKNAGKFQSHRKIDTHLQEYKSFDGENTSFILTLYSANRYEWVLTDIACASYAITNTALYDTLGVRASEFILEMTESPVVVCSKNHIDRILEMKREFPEKLEHVIAIISMDPLDLLPNSATSGQDVSLVNECKDSKISLFDMNRVIKIGSLFPIQELYPNVDSLYSISFTSGTTGSMPKGVMLSHKTASAGIIFALTTFGPVKNGKSFSFLPLAHIYERQTVAFVVAYGGCVGFPQLDGTPLTLTEDLKIYKPHHMSNVPRVFTRIESLIKQATLESPSSLKRTIIGKGLEKKMELQSLHDGSEGSMFFFDRVILKSIRDAVGYTDMRFVVTGSAPISASTIKFIKAALNVGMAQGYGLTESFAGVCASGFYELTPGSCGPVGIGAEIRLKELPEMGYTALDPDGPRGELLLRGYAICNGYYKNKEENEKSFDEEGWFQTGDIARIDPETGKVSIIDRVKNFFKLSQGEYVTPERVEGIYLSRFPIFSQLFVHGDSMRSFLVGIAGVDINEAANFLLNHCNVAKSSLSSDAAILNLINAKENKLILLKYVNSRIPDLKGFEKVHNLFLDIEPLSLEREVVTPTMKIKRPVAAKFFSQEISSMYDEGSLTAGPKL